MEKLASVMINYWKENKTKTKLSYHLAIPLLGIYPEKTIIQKDICTALLIIALFIIAKNWK